MRDQGAAESKETARTRKGKWSRRDTLYPTGICQWGYLPNLQIWILVLTALLYVRGDTYQYAQSSSSVMKRTRDLPTLSQDLKRLRVKKKNIKKGNKTCQERWNTHLEENTTQEEIKFIFEYFMLSNNLIGTNLLK